MGRRILFLLGAVSLLGFVIFWTPIETSQARSNSTKETFSALAFLPNGAGPRMVAPGATANLTIHLYAYTPDDNAKLFASTLLQKGPDDLLKMLEKTKSIGKVTMTGHVGFFDLKLIRSRPTETGRRVVGVCDRPIGFLEMYASERSLDNKFGVLIMDLKTNDKGKEKGEGQLIYAAKVKVLEGKKVEVENYGISPVKLQGVTKL